MRATSRHTLGMLLVLALAGCSRGEPPAPAMAASLDDEISMILPDLMDLIVDPAAGVLFAAAGQHAWNDREPRTEEAWQAVGDAASQLMRTSDTLAKPALARGRADWLQWADALRDGAAAAGAAARRHDPRSLYAAGEHVRASCQACHARHASQIAEPLALGGPR